MGGATACPLVSHPHPHKHTHDMCQTIARNVLVLCFVSTGFETHGHVQDPLSPSRCEVGANTGMLSERGSEQPRLQAGDQGCQSYIHLWKLKAGLSFHLLALALLIGLSSLAAFIPFCSSF